MKKLTAIDLYSGIGGWSLGLRMAGIDVIASYDIWSEANLTNLKNNGHHVVTTDLRSIDIETLPRVDLVVGSPPCTQLSYANRGGRGDIEDGLRDIAQFLRIVDHLKPQAWVMENVPRMATLLDSELKPGGRLNRFSHLPLSYAVLDMAEFGLPQRRKRCIAGSFNIALLKSYRNSCSKRTLGQVLEALRGDVVVDPIYGIDVPATELTDHVLEDRLSEEELRINRANKIYHPVYNRMPFPDPLHRSVRTITATCTRVSRESIIVNEPGEINGYRRLTVRERASLQGFPLEFQFFAETYAKKLRMIGNAVPPVFSFHVARSLLNSPTEDVGTPPFVEINRDRERPQRTSPPKVSSLFPRNRSFRFAIPSLRLSSGVRFELKNEPQNTRTNWRVGFAFGTSKSIHTLTLSEPLLLHLLPLVAELPDVGARIEELISMVSTFDVEDMQARWSHRGEGEHHPFELLDVLDQVGVTLTSVFARDVAVAQTVVLNAIALEHREKVIDLKGVDKLRRNATTIASGLMIGCAANSALLFRSEKVGTASAKQRLCYGS